MMEQEETQHGYQKDAETRDKCGTGGRGCTQSEGLEDKTAEEGKGKDQTPPECLERQVGEGPGHEGCRDHGGNPETQANKEDGRGLRKAQLDNGKRGTPDQRDGKQRQVSLQQLRVFHRLAS